MRGDVFSPMAPVSGRSLVMGGTSPLDPAMPPAPCQKCGNRATVRFVEDLFARPPVELLLCNDCADTENGRVVWQMMKAAGAEFPAGFPAAPTDDQLRQLMRSFRDPANWE